MRLNVLTSSNYYLRSFYSFDLELPMDVDDEYWQPIDGSEPFKQPPERPTAVSAFIHLLKLSQILSFTLRSIVCHLTMLHSAG